MPPGGTPTTLTRSSWLFPPRTREVQFDEKWSFVGKKQKNCDPAKAADAHRGDWWDHLAYDPEHRLVLAVVPGARSIENAEAVVAGGRRRTAGAVPRLLTSDEYPAYTSAIEKAFSVPVEKRPGGPGRRPILPERRLPEGLTYDTVHKERQNDRVVAVERRPAIPRLTGPKGTKHDARPGGLPRPGDGVVDEPQLLDHRRGDHERVGVGLA